jgi:hypothetical protein
MEWPNLTDLRYFILLEIFSVLDIVCSIIASMADLAFSCFAGYTRKRFQVVLANE